MRLAPGRLAPRLLALLLGALAGPAAGQEPGRADGAVRIAAFNAALSRPGAGVLLGDIAEREAQVMAVAEIVLRVRPDVLLLNEFDHDHGGEAIAAFAALLAEGVAGLQGLDYPHRVARAPNTGVPSGHDLDGDGRQAGPRDAFGFGEFPGQYGMALLSRLPVEEVRSFTGFRWAALPGALRPHVGGRPFHDDAAWQALRLPSKALWHATVRLPGGRPLHLLASHPTPPVFDGPEDLNGRRNADEIRLLAALIDGAEWLVDDSGGAGGLPTDAAFVVLGDLNADPQAGESRPEGIGPLLSHPRVADPRPRSPGGAAAPGPRADPAEATASWPDPPGNLRVDYVLPSKGLEVTGSGVFWPGPGDPLAPLVEASDHRLVWVDIRP